MAVEKYLIRNFSISNDSFVSSPTEKTPAANGLLRTQITDLPRDGECSD
jgi:hypothetical protein